MAAERTVPVKGLSVTVRELTVAEVRDWFVEIETGVRELDPVQAFALDECGLDDLARMCDVTAAELEPYAPSELDELKAVAKALNPHFFKVRAALNGVARVVFREAEALASTARPASS